MEKDHNDAETSPSTSTYRIAGTATDLIIFANAIKEAAQEIKSFGQSYPRVTKNRLEEFLTDYIDFIDSVNKAWEAILKNLIADKDNLLPTYTDPHKPVGFQYKDLPLFKKR